MISPAMAPAKSVTDKPCHMQASTALTASFTPFTLANFTQSIMVNLTNVNGTNQNPTGASCLLLHSQHRSEPGC